MKAFANAVSAALSNSSPSALRVLAGAIEAGRSRSAVVPGIDVHEILKALERDGLTPAVAAAYVRGVADGCGQSEAAEVVEVVWSGPSSANVPVRASGQVLADLINTAQRELVLVTYSARRYTPVDAALRSASARGVDVVIVVETLVGAGGLLKGVEPAKAFKDIPGVRLFHWPIEVRSDPNSRMHAKLAIADRRVLFMSSVNLTQSALERSMEAGLLVTGGHAPQRAAEHIDELRSKGILRSLDSAY
jgi:phosphatidylserine/phosphatidylglycerophosphate/cardiolipin synthase-like enzyme